MKQSLYSIRFLLGMMAVVDIFVLGYGKVDKEEKLLRSLFTIMLTVVSILATAKKSYSLSIKIRNIIVVWINFLVSLLIEHSASVYEFQEFGLLH